MNITKLLSRTSVLTTALVMTTASTNAATADTTKVVSPYDTFSKYRVGGYGEMVAAWKDYGTNRFFGGQYGNSKESRSTISIPRFVVRLDWRGVRGLRIGGSFYFCKNIGANSDKQQTYEGLGDIPLRIWTFDGQYRNRLLTTRAESYVSRRETYISRREIYVSRRATYISRREI